MFKRKEKEMQVSEEHTNKHHKDSKTLAIVRHALVRLGIIDVYCAHWTIGISESINESKLEALKSLIEKEEERMSKIDEQTENYRKALIDKKGGE